MWAVKRRLIMLVISILVPVLTFAAGVVFVVVMAVASVTGTNTGDPCSTADVPAAASGSFSAEQISNARVVDAAASAAGLPGQATLVGLAAALGESDLVNIGYGDQAGPDSAGLFQQRPSQGWGTRAQVMDPFYAATRFYTGPNHDRASGLVAIVGWESLPITEAIHRVQRNADPSHYTKFIGRAQAVAKAAGLDLARAGAGSGSSALPGGCGGPIVLGSGPCPLDGTGQGITTCDAAIAFMGQQMDTGSRGWHRLCLGLVSQAYGGVFVGYPTAYSAALAMQASHLMQPATTDYNAIPRGAVLWFDGNATGNTAGHVAIAIGNGNAISNDVPVNDGRVGVVPISFFVDNWHQTFMGWSPPNQPN